MAEIEVRQSNAKPSTNATNAVNKVRNRARLDVIYLSNRLNQKKLSSTLYRQERSKEFLYKGQRKIDLI
ncbi:RagB/SusD family nutrient uptake outer membrane protein [Bacteroides sp.]|uniref:RagB/SusD family nutrient uptake outer membrane protein n=1 Tax=Bacteroides sp. TaxID=29523 RepID=UPI00260AE6B7|nr:RagB/SusD family nutrient uptake outer membrane protein [Bacteroides sp.]MDD3036386.1 RagB/SusD family nutrient uptake outer membrane protein [Bacteroides sp.]